MTMFTNHFRGDPLGIIRTDFVASVTCRAILADAIMVRTVLCIVRILTHTTKIASVQRGRYAGDSDVLSSPGKSLYERGHRLDL